MTTQVVTVQSLGQEFPKTYKHYRKTFFDYLKESNLFEEAKNKPEIYSRLLQESLESGIIIDGKKAQVTMCGGQPKLIRSYERSSNLPSERSSNLPSERSSNPSVLSNLPTINKYAEPIKQVGELELEFPKDFRYYNAVFQNYLKKQNLLNAAQKNPAVYGEFLRMSLTKGILIDGITAYIVTYGGAPQFVPSTLGLINALSKYYGFSTNIAVWLHEETFTLGRQPTIEDKKPIIGKSLEEYIQKQQAKYSVHDIDYILVRATRFKNGAYEHIDEVSKGTELLEKTKKAREQRNPTWSGKYRWTDPIEMMKKTAIKALVKRLPIGRDDTFDTVFHPTCESPPDIVAQKPIDVSANVRSVGW